MESENLQIAAAQLKRRKDEDDQHGREKGQSVANPMAAFGVTHGGHLRVDQRVALTPNLPADTLSDMTLPRQPLPGRKLHSTRVAWDWLGLYLASVVLIPRDAFAYLDPGTGSMLIQMIVGGVAGTIVVVKLHWSKIKRFFGIKPLDAPESGAGHDRR